MIVEIEIQLSLHHPIRKLLIPINKSSYLIYFCCNSFKAKETNMK